EAVRQMESASRQSKHERLRPTDPAASKETIARAVARRLAYELGLDPEQVDGNVELATLGVDSFTVTALRNDISGILGFDVAALSVQRSLNATVEQLFDEWLRWCISVRGEEQGDSEEFVL